MRKVILQEFVSLDGLAAGPNANVDFVPGSMQGDQSFGRHQIGFIDTLDTILLGRVTYQMFAEYWPNVTTSDDEPFADKLNALPKVVFSKTLDRAPWGEFADARVVDRSASDEIAKLKQEPGTDMVIWGSISLAQSLMGDGLIDEYALVVCPVVLGRGKPLFRDKVDSLGVKLVETKTFDRGAVLLRYAPERPSS